MTSEKPVACQVVASRSFRVLKDTDPMPFGPYRGERMQDVPASYLEQLLDKEWIGNWPGVEEYVERNQAALLKEIDRSDRSHSRY